MAHTSRDMGFYLPLHVGPDGFELAGPGKPEDTCLEGDCTINGYGDVIAVYLETRELKGPMSRQIAEWIEIHCRDQINDALCHGGPWRADAMRSAAE